MMTKEPRIGRPFKTPEDGERVMLGLRVSADLKRKLDDAATKSGRSQSQETEMRLQQTFDAKAQEEKIIESEKRIIQHVEAKLAEQSEEQKAILREVQEAKDRLLRLIALSEAAR
jgi:hypothetical protein